MSVENSNKQVVRNWLDAVNSADEQALLDMLAEGFVFKTMARQPEWLRYKWSAKEFAAAPNAQSSVMEAPIRMEEVKLIAEGDTVALEAISNGRLKNGKLYDNAYSLIFEICDGKIREAREYSCSYLVVQTFGEFDPNNPEASAAATA